VAIGASFDTYDKGMATLAVAVTQDRIWINIDMTIGTGYSSFKVAVQWKIMISGSMAGYTKIKNSHGF
jgi:hypothetical protein